MEPFPLHTDPLPLTTSREPLQGGSRAEGNGAHGPIALDALARGLGAGACASADLEP
jgi:hypothetical protein